MYMYPTSNLLTSLFSFGSGLAPMLQLTQQHLVGAAWERTRSGGGAAAPWGAWAKSLRFSAAFGSEARANWVKVGIQVG